MSKVVLTWIRLPVPLRDIAKIAASFPDGATVSQLTEVPMPVDDGENPVLETMNVLVVYAVDSDAA